MRADKKYLSKAVEGYLKTSNYFFLTNFQRVTVAEIAHIRSHLTSLGAEFHVIKNNILELVAQNEGLPSLEGHLKGPTALIAGGKNPSEVAKVLSKFQKDKDKAEFKGGVLEGRLLSVNEVMELSKLPSIEVLKATLLRLLNTPAQQFVYVLQASQQSLLNVLTRYAEMQSGA
jgi:large subunit ribosomal protein L10